MKSPECVCKTSEEYIRVALALETLAYHDKNYLDTGLLAEGFNDDGGKTMREILFKAKRLDNGEVLYADTWV